MRVIDSQQSQSVRAQRAEGVEEVASVRQITSWVCEVIGDRQTYARYRNTIGNETTQETATLIRNRFAGLFDHAREKDVGDGEAIKWSHSIPGNAANRADS